MRTEQHLRRIRIRLTLIYSLMMAAGLMVLSLLAINVDNNLRTEERDQDFLLAAQRGAQAVSFADDGSLDTAVFEQTDNLVGSWPQLWVYVPDDATESGVSVVAGPTENWITEDDVEFDWVANEVMFADVEWTVPIWSANPEVDITARGVRVNGGEGQVAAVIAVAESAGWFTAHGNFRDRVLAIAGALVMVSAFGGYALAGRTIRPAALALEQQEQLISDAAHELRTPVARIRAAAEGGLAGDEPIERALNRVALVAENAGDAIDDLLTLARMDAGKQGMKKESLRLDLLVEQVADSHKNVTLHVIPTIVYGDAGLLRRAIDNLLRNAAAHGVSEGMQPNTIVTVYPSVVRVEDNGPGLDERTMDSIFERFQSRAGSDGHGLGLPIVRWVADAHRAEISAENRSEGGAKFSLVFPERP